MTTSVVGSVDHVPRLPIHFGNMYLKTSLICVKGVMAGSTVRLSDEEMCAANDMVQRL